MLGGKGGGVEHRECPKCKNLVHVNKSGKLGSHRVGVNMKQSWPCPGDDLGIE